ncbi:hypothetical protein [Paenibacillus qinlingensis]|uniref:Uncharacterized protein n=1 Tax=Paenibacillus qinlingensis TaxID=1837343 RepID=A0ABU1P343_9BACL|nr:hypothetical protein [Paenibacillus qinlingensis]MDR6553969.1 hypothetical protein [Paenibacillus qinlingensis]
MKERAELENKLVLLEHHHKDIREKKEQLLIQTEKLKELPNKIKTFKDKTKFEAILKNLEPHERLLLLNDIIISASITKEGMDIKMKHPYLDSNEVKK